uniref:uncharacterized protein LOC122589040 n=1 Tax=Erigeron canadensis TaxID=72917 RepID=UPI001CB8E6C3|nr:uncharacterized protein LOC122589040 [Erigeron canadensis]
MNEKIIVYEHGYNRSLDEHLDNASFSWVKRLKLCMDVARVLDSVNIDGIVLKQIKSSRILVNSDWDGKVSNLELSLIKVPTWRKQELAYYYETNEILAVLLEILCGRLDRGKSYSEPLLYLAERHLGEKENLDELVFEGIKEKIAPESLNLFTEIVKNFFNTPVSPGNVGHVLQDAYLEQKYVEESPQISLKIVESATHNFSDEKCIGEGRYWKLYEGEFLHANGNGHTTALVKRWDSKSSEGRNLFFKELKFHFLCIKNENVVAIEGYCSEKGETIIVYEHAYNRSLNKDLDDTSLSWAKRFNIGIDVARALYPTNPPAMIDRDFRSDSILIDCYWNAKVSLGYVDPQRQESGLYNSVYSLGVVLLEMLCGRLAWPEGCEDHSQSLVPLVQRHYKDKGNIDELVFEGLKEQIVPESLIAYQEVALQCISETEEGKSVVEEMIERLKNALDAQVEYEIWGNKVPKEYKELKEYILWSRTPTEVKEDLYDILTNGILLQQGTVWFTLGANGERTEMISAMTFSYKNRSSRKWQSIPKSRFKKVAQILDISNLKIQIRIKTQFLTPGIKYGVYLVFKFYRSRNFRAREYVNLSYKMGKYNLHSYFATQRDDEWMMIELLRFSNDKKDVDFDAILKSFSRCYCGTNVIYVEGIEFRSINNVNYGEIGKSKHAQQILKSSSNIDEMFCINEMNRKKHLRLSPMEFLYDSCNAKPFDFNPSSLSRCQEVEFLPQQVFGIKCKIESRMLSPDTDYMCYLVFKFSEKCNGLHGPVMIRDVLNWKNKETRILYFRYPSPWNLHDTDWVPKQRKDGWMEVMVWKFNSKSKLRNDNVPMNLKLITYDGTMCGLIVCSLEIRPN